VTRRRAAVLAAALLLSAACGLRSAPAPTGGATRGSIPNLSGQQVLVLPVQSMSGVTGNADAELTDALAARGGAGGVRWVMPAALRAMVARSPALDVPVDALPVGVFLQAEVRRIGDPLYGQLRRLAALANGRLALVPVAVRHRADTPERPGAVEVVATLLDTSTGDVFWFGVVEGAPGGGADPRALASAADALARRLVPQPGGE
jgi:hypothetical protein